MISITDALIPVLAMILAGFIIQRTNFLPPAFWPSAEKLTYFLLMPATLIHNLAGKKTGTLPWLKMLLTVEGAVPLRGEAVSQLPPSEVLAVAVQGRDPVPPLRI